jgi:hypothetical protein
LILYPTRRPPLISKVSVNMPTASVSVVKPIARDTESSVGTNKFTLVNGGASVALFCTGAEVSGIAVMKYEGRPFSNRFPDGDATTKISQFFNYAHFRRAAASS